MCLACRKAGRENQACVQDGVDFETVEEDLKKLHKRCAWPGTCSCQHKVGDGHINKEFR
jgi:hypothetical protein